MFDKLLVAVELSHVERSKAILDVAKRIAGKGTEIELINVLEDVPPYVAVELPPGLFDNIRADAQAVLDDLAKDAGLEAKTLVRSGSPAATILDVAHTEKANLIVVGSHKPGLEDYLLGSTAARVVRHAMCSVLVVR